MKVVIDDQVKETLRVRNKNIITIDFGILTSCWSIMPEVFIRHQNPGDFDKFEKVEVGNFTVFLNKELIIDDEVRVKFPEYASDLADKEFEVVGAKPPIQ